MSAKWWAVYRGCQYLEHVRAMSGERALDVMAEREGVPLAEMTAYLDDPRGINPLGMLPYFSQQLGPEFSEPGPADPGKEVV